MKDFVLVIQIISGVLLVGLVTVQSKGSGLGRVWGSGKASSFTRRGLEKLLFKATFVVAFIFTVISILQVAL